MRELAEKIERGKRVTAKEALRLYSDAPLIELGRLANYNRQRFNPEKIVSFLIDRNINYTNVCNTDCTFCAFYRHDPRDPESYVLSREILAQKITEALEFGATRILLQGGHNDELPYTYYTDLVRWIKEHFAIEINAFSPSEIHQIALISGKSYPEILGELKECGLSGLPGGGAEILDDEVRKRVSPKKISANLWLEIMEIAQSLGLTTTATMVIGLGESVEQRVGHLAKLRKLQDQSLARGFEGFNAFISWVLQFNEKTSLGRSKRSHECGATSIEYLRNLAVARIFLDNIPHHQSSWPTLGLEIAQIGLHFGCDDIGSTMMEENVVSAAGALTQHKWSMSPEELRVAIEEAGFIPAQRNTAFETLHVFCQTEIARDTDGSTARN